MLCQADAAEKVRKWLGQFFAASKETEHEQLWNYILSLESPDVDGGGAQAFYRGKRGAGAQSGDRLGRLRRVATRYGRDPKEIAAADHKYFDRGAESRVYDTGEGTVIKVRRLDMDTQIEAARRLTEARRNASEDEWTADDEARFREQEEVGAALEDEDL